MLRVLAPASSLALISLAEVKERLDLSTDESDAALRRVIGDASAAIVAELGFDLGYQRYSETVAVHGGASAILSRWPIETASVEAKTSFGAESLGWSLSGSAILRRSSGCYSSAVLVVTYSAGYLLPDQVSTWSASAVVVAGSWIRPTSPSSFRFRVTVSGALGGLEPAWPTEPGASVQSGAATLLAHEVPELPDALRALAWREVLTRWSARDRDPGQRIAAVEGSGIAERYFAPTSGGTLESSVLAGLELWRYPR